MKPGLALRVSQHLSLTPQLQQSIRLLQLSTLELSQEVEQMLGDNPFLEQEEDEQLPDMGPGHSVLAPDSAASSPTAETDSYDGSPDGSSAEDADYAPSDWEGDGSQDAAYSDGEWGSEAAPRSAQGDSDSAEAQELARTQERLTEHLERQVLALRLAPAERAALLFLIASLNEDGFLEDSLQTLAANAADAQTAADPERMEQLLHSFTVALHLLHHLEPSGVGARHLGECLSLQLRSLQEQGEGDASTLATAQLLCRQPLELLARRDLRRLTQIVGADEGQVRAAMALIARLEPRPGRCFADVQRNIIVPDVIVKKSRNGFVVQLNTDVMPRLRVHELYANALRGQRGSQSQPALQSRLQEARWFIKNLQQRFDTILRVSDAIVQRQKNFLVHGAIAMQPLVLREIAETLGLHESTISRVTNGKYMATPQGTFELKYFFGSGLDTETGASASSTAVRALIKQFIAAEPPKKPLSDNKIAEMLKEQGIECARRTVAKYREALKIAPAHQRKTL